MLFLDLTGDLLALPELEMGGLGGIGFRIIYFASNFGASYIIDLINDVFMKP